MCAPSEVDCEDTYKEGSFWWGMRSLLDEINGNADGDTYEQRHAIVRSLFDALENRWLAEVNAVEMRAAALKNDGKVQEAADMLYAYTEKCVGEAQEAIERAKKMFRV